MTTTLKQVLESPSIYLPTTARIVATRPMANTEKVFTIELPKGLSLNHRPGQFVGVSVLGVGEAPISISSSPAAATAPLNSVCARPAT